MSVYNRFILPRIIKKTCSTKPISKQREKIVPLAEGRVLEIGVGNGMNIPYYDNTKVTHVFGLDISPELMEGAVRRARQTGLDFEPLLLDATEIPLDANAVDTVLVTYTMCSIDALQSALAEMHRVLKPSGKLVFCELSEGMLRFRAVATIKGVVLPKGNGKEECSSLRVELDEELKEDPHALNLHSLIQEYFVEDMFHPVAGGPCILRIQKDDGLLILIFLDRETGRTLPLSVKISSVELLEQ